MTSCSIDNSAINVIGDCKNGDGPREDVEKVSSLVSTVRAYHIEDEFMSNYAIDTSD